MVRWRPLVYNKKILYWSWRLLVCSRGNNLRKSTLIWRIIPMNFQYKFKNWRAYWKQFTKHPIKFLNLFTWTIGWRSEELLLDNALLKVKNQTLADRNSKWKELCKSSLKDRSKKVWRLFLQTNKPTWMNWLHTGCILKATSMTNLLAN